MFKLKYLYNGVEIEKAQRGFEANVFYPPKLKFAPIESNGVLVPQPQEGIWSNSIEAETAISKIITLLKRVLKSDSENYLWEVYSRGGVDVPMEESLMGNTITVQIVNEDFPVYNQLGEKGVGTVEALVIEKTFLVDEFVPMGSFVPNFWKVFYDWDEQTFITNKRKDGNNYGILSFLMDSIYRRKYTNKYTLRGGDEKFHLFENHSSAYYE